MIDANFSEKQFAPATVAAWLAFYVEAERAPAIRHLLMIYRRRLNSNLMHGLRQVTGRDRAERIAEGIGALIDGLYLRRASAPSEGGRTSALALIHDYLDTQLAQGNAQ